MKSNRCTITQTYNDDMIEGLFDQIGTVYSGVGVSFTHTEMFAMVRLMPISEKIEINLTKVPVEQRE